MSQRENHSTVSAYMMASNAPKIIDFMKDVFGAEVVLRHDRDNGTVMHASVRIGDSVVMISDGMDSAPAFPIWLHVYVADADAVYRKALQHGATSVQDVSDQPDGDRRGAVKDIAGNTWWIATARV